MTKSADLYRFIKAQEKDYSVALLEIKNGKKRSHWMWYIFPQIQGLGFSEMSVFYAIRDLQEATEFLRHPLLGQRLINICNVLLALKENDPGKILGSPDDMKLKSSMTLFASLPDVDPVFDKILTKFFNGEKDNKTLKIIK